MEFDDDGVWLLRPVWAKSVQPRLATRREILDERAEDRHFDASVLRAKVR